MDIGILVSRNGISDFRVRTLAPILEDNQFNIKVAIIDNRKGKTFKEKFIKNLKRGRGGYMIIMALKKIFSKPSKNVEIGIKTYCQKHNILTIETTDPYSDKTLSDIREHNLDVLLLVSGYGIIDKSLINLTPQGILSYHHGNMRKYRGMPPVFWELYHNEKEVGITLQKLSVGLDCGLPIEEKSVQIHKGDTLKLLENRVQEESVFMLYQSLCKVVNDNYKPIKINEFGKVYTLPNLREWITFNFKILFRRLYA